MNIKELLTENAAVQIVVSAADLREFALTLAKELKYGQQEQARRLKGLPGIMEIFQCSRSKAARLKESGVLDCAITPVQGRTFIIDERKAIEAMNRNRGGRR